MGRAGNFADRAARVASPTRLTSDRADAPTISDFSPAIAVAGATVSVTGTNFATNPTHNRASIDVTAAALTSPTATSFSTKVPVLAGSGPIALATPAGMAVSSTDVFVPPSPFTAADVQFTARMAFGSSQLVTIGTANRIGPLTFAGGAGQHVSVRGTNGMSGQILGCDVYVSIRRHDNTILAQPACMESSGFIDDLTLPVTDNAASVQTEFTYEPFGAATASGASSTNALQLTGRENDGTGLMYYRARFYVSAAAAIR